MRGVTKTFLNSVKIIFASKGASEEPIDPPSNLFLVTFADKFDLK